MVFMSPATNLIYTGETHMIFSDYEHNNVE